MNTYFYFDTTIGKSSRNRTHLEQSGGNDIILVLYPDLTETTDLYFIDYNEELEYYLIYFKYRHNNDLITKKIFLTPEQVEKKKMYEVVKVLTTV